MEKYFDIMKRTLDLAETGLEGLQFVKTKMEDGYYENTVVVLKDTVEAFAQMEQSLSLFIDDLPANKIQSNTNKLRTLLEKVVLAYEQENYPEALQLMDTKLIKEYKKWQKELTKHLQPYVLN